jgi:hypothetical protein
MKIQLLMLTMLLILIANVEALGVSPSSLSYNQSIGEEKCLQVTVNSVSANISVSDLWAENKDVEWKFFLFDTSSTTHGLSLNYLTELPIGERQFNVCLSGSKAGEYHGVLLLKEEKVGNSVIQMGIWLKVTISGGTIVNPISPGGGGGGGIPVNKTTLAVTPVLTPATEETIAPSELFDIKLELDSSTIKHSNELFSVIRFESFGNVPTPVDLTYSIVDLSGKEVYSEKGNVTVTTEQIVRKNFESLNLPAGKYTLVLTTVYGNNVKDEFRQVFEVGKAGALKNTSNWILFIIVGGAVIALIIIFIMVYRKKRHLKWGD